MSSTLTTAVLNEDGEEQWAYAALDGHLRCPDCNSNLECEADGETVFPTYEWEGGHAVTTERCHDCGVLLANDPACSPKEIVENVLRSFRVFGEDSVFAHYPLEVVNQALIDLS